MQLKEFKVQRWERGAATAWHPVLNRFDTILAAFADPAQRNTENPGPSEELVVEVLRVLHDVVYLHQELKGAVDRLRELLQCSELPVLLGALKCLTACPHSRQSSGVPIERRLEVLACAGAPSVLGSMSFRDACSVADYDGGDFQFEVLGSGTNPSEPAVLKVPAASATEDFEALRAQFEASETAIPELVRPAFLLQLRLWCRARTLKGRREVAAISLLAICNAVKHIGPHVLQQFLQKRPGLLAELCELMQSLHSVGADAGVAALKVASAILDSRFGQSRSEASQLSQMLGLSLPHGIVACALRGLLGHEPTDDQSEDHNKVLLAALDLFQITTVSNHQTTAQLGHAGMILAMLELMQKTEVQWLPVVTAMLRCLELAAEVSGTAAVVLFRDFNGLQAFSLRLQREVELIMDLDFTANVFDTEPPKDDNERQRFWALLEEITARRRLCRQLLKNIQTALQSSEVLQAGLAHVFQGPLMDALKIALKEPPKVGVSLFGTAIDIVSSIIQDDPSRVPQMIESGVLPGIMAALNKETLRSAECLSFVPGVLASIALHAVGEDFLLNSPSKPIQLLTEILVDSKFAPLLHSQPEIAQIMSTQVDKVLRNRPSGPNKLTEHVVECMLSAMRSILEESKAYPDWTPLDLEDHTEYLADRLAPFSRFCWSILQTNEQTLKSFLEKNGLALVRQLQEMPCLPFHLTSLEGQQHPMASLFNLQARGPDGHLAIASELKNMLASNLDQAEGTLKECLKGDPFVILGSMEEGQVLPFLRSLSLVSAALEGLLSVCREGSSVQVLEAVRAPLKEISRLCGSIFSLAAWYPQERERLPSTVSYHEMIKNLFTPPEDTQGASASSSSEAKDASKEKEAHLKGKPLLEAARQSFRLTNHAARQLLVVISKQLHSRARTREVTPTISGLAMELAEVAKVCLSSAPTDAVASVNMRWTSDIFDLLLRMHEEQNRVAVRPLSLSSFYQVGGFELLGPVLQKVKENLDLESGSNALGSALAYLEKVTSHKRFTNAPQVGLLKTEDGFIPKDLLCRSVQSEALRVLLPVWREGELARFPENAARSLMKVWVHALDGPRDIPPRPNQSGSASNRGTATVTSAAAPRSAGLADSTRQSMVSSLVDMGFSRDQVERRMNQVEPNTRPDIATMIMLMASEPAQQETGVSTTEIPTVTETTNTQAETDSTREAPGVKPKSTAEFQQLVSDMLKDLLPQILLFGKQVPKAIPVVADAMAFIVAVPLQLWDHVVGKNGTEANATAVVQACLDALGDDTQQPPPECLACVTQVLASLLHRRQQVALAVGTNGAQSLLKKLRTWCLASIDFEKSAKERGYRLLHASGNAPVPPGVGEPLLAPPTWLTPVMVCVHQLLSKAELVKLREGGQALDAEIQQLWVALVLDVVYAFPGLDGGLAQSCMQVLTRLCATNVGTKALISYQLNPKFPTPSSAPPGTIVALQLLLRVGKQASFQGFLQMLASFMVLLLEEGPTLQQHMETEILQLFSSKKEMPARDIYRQLFPLMSRNPPLFEEAMKAVTQRKRSDDSAVLVLEAIPEAERQRGSKSRGQLPPTALPVLQTLVNEIGFRIDVQFRTSYVKLHEAASKTVEKGEEPGPTLPPPFPLALGPNCILCVLDGILLRIQGLSALLLKPPLPITGPLELQGDETTDLVIQADPSPEQKSLLLLMMRHLLPRLAQLSELWPKQVELLRPSQKTTLNGAINPVQRLLPHLGAVLCSAARHPGEPRRALVTEAVVALRVLAEGSPSMDDRGSYGAQVATISTIVARLLSAASAAERKDEKDGEQESPETAQDGSAATSPKKGQTASKTRPSRSRSFFAAGGELQALRDGFVAVLQRLSLKKNDAPAVAGSVIRCLELLTRRDVAGATGPETGRDADVAADVVPGESIEDARVLRALRDAPLEPHVEAVEDQPGVLGEDEDEMGEGGDDPLDEDDEGWEMEQIDGEEVDGDEDGDPHAHDEDGEEDGDEDDDAEYDDEDEEDFDGEGGDFAGDGHGIASVVLVNELRDQLLGDNPALQHAVHVFDQPNERPGEESGMTFRVDIDLGEGGVMTGGVHRGAQMRRMQMHPRGLRAAQGTHAAGAWAEPGEMDPPSEHPLLRREPVPHENENTRGLPPWMAPAGGLRHILGSNFEHRHGHSTSQATPANPPVSEDFDAIFNEASGRLQPQLRVPDATPATPAEVEEVKESPAATPAVETPAAEIETPAVAEAPATAVTEEAAEEVPAEVPVDPPTTEAPTAPPTVGPTVPAEPPADAVPPPPVVESSEAPEAETEEDPAAALGIAELERLATSLGCTQTALLQAAEIDASVVAELPEDMRSAVVMATLSQVNVDHLRRPRSAGSATGGSATGAAAVPAAGPGPVDPGFEEIDASVLEALPPEIRAEVMAEEQRRREQAERQAAQAAAAAQAPAGPDATAGAGAGAASGDMDNASFIASLDPMLREEVLMTAPEEVLQTLPAELVAEAQMIRDRAFMRIAREGPPPQPAPARPPVAQNRPRPVARQHQYLQAMEQQLAQLGGQQRAWLQGFSSGVRAAGEDFMAQLGMALGGGLALGRNGRQAGEEFVTQLGMALGSRGNRQAPVVVAATAGNNSPRLSSFDKADRVLLERLVDYDEENCQDLEAPLPFAAIPSVCQLLYFRNEVSVTPLTRLFFNLSLHPLTRNFTLGQFLVLLCKEPSQGSGTFQLPPAHLYEGGPDGQLPISTATEVKAVGSQRVLQIMAYLLRRIPQCGEFFAKPLQKETWLEGDAPLVSGGHVSDLVGHCSVNVLLQLLTTTLFLASSRHAAWLLAILHALLVPQKPPEKDEKTEKSSEQKEAPVVTTSATTTTAIVEDSPKPTASAEQQSFERWSKITTNMHGVLSQDSVLALCRFLCQAGSGHGSSGEADTFQMAGEILVALAASQEHLAMVRSELMRVLSYLVTSIEADLSNCEPGSADPSTMETRLLRLVRTLSEVFKEAAKAAKDQELKIEEFLQEARLEDLWNSLDRTLDRLHDTEVFATPAQRILSTGVAPSQLRVESAANDGTAGGSGSSLSGTLASNVQTTPPKPLLNRLLPLIEAFFVLHNGSKEAEMERKEKDQKKAEQEGGSSSSRLDKQVFADLVEVTLVERSRFGQFCKQHRRPVNALIKQTPSLLNKSFSPVLKHMPQCLDFDNKRAYFRSQLRSRRMESRYETIRLRVRRSEIFMDSYHQLRNRTGEEMRAKIQVQFQGEEGIDAGGVGKEWYGALAKEIFNPNYALFVQAGGKACTYHPNPMSYVTRDHLDFFHFIGRVIGKAIHDAQNLEAWFTRGFYKHMLGKKVIAADLEAFDPEYFSNLKWMLDNDITDIIELYFCAESDELGQMKVVDLKPNGRTLPVTNENKYEYIQLMSEHKMTNAVRQQIDAFLKGLHEIVPPELLSLFDDKELELLISGLPDIDIEDLKANTEYHNYTPQSDQIQWFWKVLSELSQEQRAWFLQFATGTSRVPVEGFKGLVGMRGPQKFCIHRAYGPERLPSAHTCFNQLDLPDYPSEEVLRDKLLQAVHEGHEGFGFA